MKNNRYVVHKIDNEWRGEPPTYEVHLNPGGTADDYYEGETLAVFDDQKYANEFARLIALDPDKRGPYDPEIDRVYRLDPVLPKH